MYSSDIDVITKMAEKKARNANEKTGKYLGRAVVTGFFHIQQEQFFILNTLKFLK